MYKKLTAAFLGMLLCVFASANDYNDAWNALNKKDQKKAQELLQKATKNSATSFDAILTQLLLRTYQGNEQNLEGFVDALLSNPDKNAYLYSLWFNGTALGNYGRKTESHQLNLLNKVIVDNTFNGSMQSAAHYVKAMHHVFSNEYAKAKKEWSMMGALENWQVTGPFENISGSGFNQQHGPLANADSKAKFNAANNIEVSWFTPAKMNNEGWIFTYSHIRQNTAIVYAQTFVYAPEDMKVILNAGGSGSVKVWVNDGLVISESKERVTELDYYKNYCNLKKGYNRVLLQLGYTNNSNPNFIIRFTDDKYNHIKGLTTTNTLQPYVKETKPAANPTSIKHFAEDFFEKKIAADPNNLVNYILLSETYLRNHRFTESRQILDKALKIAPENILVKFELLQCLLKSENRTLLAQELEWLKENDPESYINYRIKINNLIEEEKYTDASEELAKIIKTYGDDEESTETHISLLAKQQKVEEMLKAINVAYQKYPENLTFLGMMFRVKKEVEKDSKAALNVYEKYLKNNYNYNVVSQLADEYDNMGMNDKYFKILEESYNQASHDPGFATDISTYYFKKQNYTKALEYAQKALELSPYTGGYWYNMATIYEQLNKKDEALDYLKKTIYYDRTNYDARKKINTLQNKADLYKLLPQVEPYELIKKSSSKSDHDFEYIFDDKGTIIYDEGASEEYITYIAKIYTDKGIDTWKEIYIPYNSSTQTFLVEKCEVVKPNGTKVPAERSGDEIVFTGLEKGDAVYVKYRLQNYSYGRLGREYWDKFTFNSFVPSVGARYTFIAPKNYKFTSEVLNAKLEPVVKEVDDYKIYTWEAKDMAPIKDEPIMPTLNDVGSTLHISTVKTWADIANWYSDISYQDNANNFELNSMYDEIFAGTKNLTPLEKARRIYNHIVTNIRYSSVSFRQSGLVPQDISKIITTKLGDCKDLSSLFVALAEKAGLKAQLVLIDTRDNGVKDMVLPSMEFNHCIALLKLDGKDHYIELTDSYLPFGSLPYNLYGALALTIPPHGEKATNVHIKQLFTPTRTADILAKNINVNVVGKDLKLTVASKINGSLTSGWRSSYATMAKDKLQEEFEKYVSNGYKNAVKLENVSFKGLNELSDSVNINYTYNVKNEVIEAGSMKMIKLPFVDMIASIESFSADKRDFPIEYWNYENTDIYETTITIQLGAGQKLLEIPENKTLDFNNSSYSIKYIKTSENTLKIVRQAKLNRNDIKPADYEKFKKFFTDIVEAESKYIVFK